ncbi:hypothetical protein HYH03_008043 [Edaphochlamys debaryana]|uniref:Apple domain-containing protein n=1 Tax=Edaphochlamys debaryana TaxID=47281 RepID=A0A836BYQ5_9CHLO|nr:hypothetical protein HYH03_008043 [Edaphochlamys debaryana]|eukprot:KAG2493825.1 hypothetical protein HYH03_008043 [Edaphochlamys debaryana]
MLHDTITSAAPQPAATKPPTPQPAPSATAAQPTAEPAPAAPQPAPAFPAATTLAAPFAAFAVPTSAALPAALTPFTAPCAIHRMATVLPPDLQPECAHFDSNTGVLMSRLDNREATTWLDVKYGSGRDQAMAFVDVDGSGVATYSGGVLELSSTAGVVTSDLPNWSADPGAAFTIVVIQALKAYTVDWSANYLVAELSCMTGPSTSGLLFGTRESFISGPESWASSFRTSKPVPVEPGWTLHAFVRKPGGTAGEYYYGGALGGITLREKVSGQIPFSVGPDRFTVGTSRCMASAKSRTQLGAVLVYNRALRVTDLKRIHEAYAPRFRWTSQAGGSLVCTSGIDVRGTPIGDNVPASSATDCQAQCNANTTCEFSVFQQSTGLCSLRTNALAGSVGSNGADPSATTCFSRPNYGDYYCVPLWDIMGTNMAVIQTMDKLTCLALCDDSTECQATVMTSFVADCAPRKDMFIGPHGSTAFRNDLGANFESCIKARAYSSAAKKTECGKWSKGGPGETKLQIDCDGDGLLDAVLFDTTGARGVALSSRNCSTADADTGYPNALAFTCPAVFNAFCAKPAGDWCPSGQTLQLDCDGDGPKDLASSCPYPSGSLCSQGRILSVDCDGDGVKDWVCQGDSGQRGVIASRKNCNAANAASGFPAAPDSACPILFGYETFRPPPPAPAA